MSATVTRVVVTAFSLALLGASGCGGAQETESTNNAEQAGDQTLDKQTAAGDPPESSDPGQKGVPSLMGGGLGEGMTQEESEALRNELSDDKAAQHGADVAGTREACADDFESDACREAAQAAFASTNEDFEVYLGQSLQGDVSQLKPVLMEMGKDAQVLNDRLIWLVELKQPETTVDAMVRIGRIYDHMGESILGMTTPANLTPEQLDAFRGALEEYAIPMHDKALQSYEAALDFAESNNVTSRESLELARERVAALSP